MIEVLQLLNALSDTSTSNCGDYSVSHLSKGDPLPEIGHGYEDTPLLQKEWIWVAKVGWKPVAILIAAPCQNFATLLRIYATKEAPRSVFVGLLRKVLADIYSRGYSRFLVSLDLERTEEARLARIIKRAGSKELGKLTYFTGSTENRW